MTDARRTVLITGAASGIGRATALRLGSTGAALALLDHNADELAHTADQARAAGSAVGTYIVDVASGTAMRDAADRAADELGPLTGIVSAAGILRPGSLDDTTADDLQHHLAVNTAGVLHCLHAAAAHLGSGGSVVIVSSNAARVPRTGMLGYAASKAAASALARCAGLELAGRGIRCNVVEPGSTDTPMQRDLWPDLAAGRLAAIQGDPNTFRLGIPLGRIAKPDDVANVVCFLLSPAARHVTLQQLYVDGGASL